MKQKNSIKGKKVRKRIVIDSIMIFLVVLAPFIFKTHQYLPRDPDATLNFLGISIGSNGFADISTFAWFILGKIIPLYLLIIWFFTCKHWWYYAILIPILMYAFQLFEVISSEDQVVDSKNIIWLLPICMILIPIIYLIRIKLYDRHVHGIDLEAMEAEIEVLKDKRNVEQSVHKKANNQKHPKNQKNREYQSLAKKENPKPASTKTPKEVGYKSLSEKIDEKLSTGNIESHFRQFQNQLGDWLHLRF